MELLPLIRRQPRRRPEVFTDAEVDALMGLDVIDSAPLAVLFDAGLRRAEAINLQLRHCQAASGYVKVIAGKGGKDRRVPMSQRLQAKLADLELLYGLGAKDHVFYKVFANGSGARRVDRGKPVGEGTFARWWRHCLDDAGVRYRTPHVARHTYATSWRRRGLASDDIAVVMGHESVRTTIDLYEQIEVEDVARRMALLEVHAE